ncbi:hypothetical protein IQ06DRAFT_309563 [Phaeosphaeriaceae sp. SRC1lsM3a]|nr:hypothetical protein IQ06DRAFT_309563 [Stagonospora sp. SRC1lsM3a]
MRPQGEKTPHNSQRIGAREACSDLQVRFLSRQGPWLALSTGKRNRLASVLSAPHRAICANCRETAIFSSLGSWMPDAALARGICRVAATVPAAKRMEPFTRSESARRSFVIGPARSTAAQACCCVPTCNVGPLVALRLRCRPAHPDPDR